MPRLAKGAREKMYDNVVSEIDRYKAQCRRRGTGYETIAKSLGLSPSTLDRRIKDPSCFTLSELAGVANTLNISLPVLLGYTPRRAAVTEEV